MKTLVKVNDLKKSYGSNVAVDGVSFEVKKGEIFGILGPNGAGKTTTLEMLETLRTIDAGNATINGLDVAKKPEEIKEIIGVLLQSSAFEEKTKLSELLEFIGSVYGKKVDSIKLLEDVQLANKASSYPEDLSGGQRQRFSVVSAMVHEPDVFFLDEPTTGLDPQARRNLWELIESIRQKGTTVIMTTHYMEEAETLCDRVAIMDKGKIIALDTPTKLVDALLKRGFKKKKEVVQANLEDVFIDLTGRELRE